VVGKGEYGLSLSVGRDVSKVADVTLLVCGSAVGLAKGIEVA
jgi:hypothetical protein